LGPQYQRQVRRKAAQGIVSSQVPLTPGRDLGAPTLWNTWTDMRIVGTSDQRYGLDVKTMFGSFVFGADRQITDDVVAGMSVSLEGSRTSGFDGFLRSTSNGINVGPYVAVRLSPNWAIDAAVTYGAYENRLELRSLEGRHLSQRFSGSLTLHGQYMLGDVYFRPKVVLSYSHNMSDAYRLSGQVLNIPINLRMLDSRFNFGLLENSLEISRLFTLSEGNAVIPYVEVGAKYEFDRPGGGQILTGDLSLATPRAGPIRRAPASGRFSRTPCRSRPAPAI
jgi:outer membrane autotransporter protein